MRIKFLSVIVSFLLISFAMSSCLGDEETIEYSPNALVQAFALDNVLGVNYAFTIDQLSGRIYNQDSLPVGSDTIIDKILIKTLTTAGFVTIRNAADTNDSIFSTTDSVNLVNTMEILPDGAPGKPFKFKVWAPDGEHTKEYSLSVRVHQQQPDSLNWGEGPIATNFAPLITGKQKSILFNSKIFVYGFNSPVVYSTSLSDGALGSQGEWNSNTIIGLTSTSFTSIVSFNNALYATVDGDDLVYTSKDGIKWEQAPGFGENTVTLISTIDQTLIAIKTFEEGQSQKTDSFSLTKDGYNWTQTDTVPANFPRDNVSVTSFKNITSVPNIMIMGNIPEANKTKNDTATIAWGYMPEQEWAALDGSSSPCPLLEDPSIMYYGDAFYAFGKDFKTFYKSEAGIVWKEVQNMFMFPADNESENIKGFIGKESDYSMVVDEDNFIWVMRSNPNEVWRGRLNRLGFARQ